MTLELNSPDTSLEERYELLGEIGRGGFGVVYRAIQRTTGQAVAIKKMLVERRSAQEFDEQKRRFEREMHLIARLKNPHIVRLVDAGFDQGLPYMVLEFVEGRPLSEVLEKGPLSPGLALRIIKQVLEALAEAHELGIVHRDLKPDNIMLSGEGLRTTAKVLDFGIAGIEENFRSTFRNEGQETITQFGQVRGTPAYMAPEQFQVFDDPKIETDIYALGLILLECLTGQPAMQAANVRALCFKQMRDPLELPESLSQSPLGAVIRKACEKAIQDRYSSADAMLKALYSIGQEGIVATGPIASPQQDTANLDGVFVAKAAPDPTNALATASLPKEKKKLWILALLLTLAVLAAAAYLIKMSLAPQASTEEAAQAQGSPTPDEAPTKDEVKSTPSTPKTAPAEPKDASPPEKEAQSPATPTRDEHDQAYKDAILNALKARTEQRFEDALQAYEQALSLQEDSAEALLGRGLMLLELKEYEEALSPLERAKAKTPADANILDALGQTHLALKRYDEAEAEFSMLLEKPEHLSQALIGLGQVHMGRESWAQARSFFEQYLEVGADTPQAPLVRAWLAEIKSKERKKHRRPKAKGDKPKEEKSFKGATPIDI